MTSSAHVYTAYLLGTPDVELEVKSARVTLDAGSSPRVTATLTVPADPDVLDALDPRLSPRVRIDVEAVFTSGTQARSFDLGVRDRSVGQESGEVELTLSSDEALLSDFAPLADDTTPFALAASLVDVVEYVLDVAIPGETLQPGPDADVTPYYPLTNLHPNPAPTSSADYGAGGGSASVGYVTVPAPAIRWTSSLDASNLIVAGSLTAFRVIPGQSYVFAIEHAAEYAGRGVAAAIQWRNNGSASTLATVYGASGVTAAATAFTRRTIVAVAPDGAEFAYPLLLTTGNVVPTFHYARQAMFYEGFEVVPYFDGDTTDSGFYDYEWADTTAPHASSSNRTPLVTSPEPAALVWNAGMNAMDFLAPLIQSVGLRLVCNEAREWTLRDETYTAAGSLSIRHGVNMVQGTDRISRDDGLWFDAAVTVYSWTDRAGIQQRRVDSYALDTPYTRLMTYDKSVAYPGPGFSEYAVRRAQGRGREVDATAVADWRADAEQAITVVLDGAPAQIGVTQRVEFDMDRDEMTVNTRTVDTPAGAIDLLAGTIDALAGTIDGL